MKKNLIALILLLTVLISYGFADRTLFHNMRDQRVREAIYTDLIWDQENCKTKLKYTEDILEGWFFPVISGAIKEYYGEYRQYGDFEILRLTAQPDSSYNMKVKVNTFVGPHNPPYGTEIITLNIDSDKVKVVDYQHSSSSRSIDTNSLSSNTNLKISGN